MRNKREADLAEWTFTFYFSPFGNASETKTVPTAVDLPYFKQGRIVANAAN